MQNPLQATVSVLEVGVKLCYSVKKKINMILSYKDCLNTL